MAGMPSSSGFIGSAPVIHSVQSFRGVTTTTICSSSFNGQNLSSICTTKPITLPVNKNVVTMKKGRLPRPMMPQRPQQQKTPLPEDGTPVFALFVRTTRTKMWYPLGAVKGDDRSKNMVDALKGGFAKGMYQQALDRGMAQTLYGKEGAKYVQGAIRLYPQLKKYVNELQFGYKVAAVGLDEQPTKIVTKEMAGSMFSSIQRGVGNWFKNVTSRGGENNGK